MIPKFEPNDERETKLICPSCGGDYLHHERVEIFECGEDASFGLHVTVFDETVVTDTSLEGNPSSRRNGLKISFWCENCDAKPVLSIVQHKGNTFFSIEHAAQPPRQADGRTGGE